MTSNATVRFEKVFESEVASINGRRKKLRGAGRIDRPDITLEPEKLGDKPLLASDGTTPLRPTEDSDVIGLALSGGGIRSAAFCLGALQALDQADILKKVDYLSTVSGGGYIGCSLSSGMTATGGHFPFKSYLSEDETPSLQHVRDYSNYLFPKGASDFLSNISIYVRGLVANAILVLPFLLAGAVITILSIPVARKVRGPNIVGFEIRNSFPFDHFVVTSYLAILLLAAAILWSISRSLPWSNNRHEVPNVVTKLVGWLVVILLLVVFCELQPFILDAMFAEQTSDFLPALVAWVRGIVLALAPVAAVVAFVAHKFGDVVKRALESERFRDQLLGIAARAAIYVAAAIVPILLWIVYLQFSYWGICLQSDCAHFTAPEWIINTAHYWSGIVPPAPFHGNIIAAFYFSVCLVCVVLILFLRPNANSLHPLYRDRLGKAFLFQPKKLVPRDPVTGDQPPLEQLHCKLSELSDVDSPYHLINTALNIQGSKQVNRRGRNADFFLFSRNFVGSQATDYAATADMESVDKGLDLGTAMAASGAAASSNMGSATIKPLTPTLALLNIRLGYWLPNPIKLAKGTAAGNWLANFYFLSEMFGLLSESRKFVYLTDGGHIENLGIYELLRRRCKVIIAVDAEADGQMAFGSFNVLERYALIDLGVRIDLPWQAITNTTKEIGKLIDETGDCEKRTGPHVAVGEISYPGGRKGTLIYIKSSLTGDENDYIFHYKKRYGAFPHETTADQLFSEEQFEAYRALGFHASYRFFDRRDRFAHLDPKQNPCVSEQMDLLEKVFPVTSAPDPCSPREHATFAAWVAADSKKAEEDKTKKAADMALAATRLASAVETAATAMAGRPSRANA